MNDDELIQGGQGHGADDLRACSVIVTACLIACAVIVAVALLW